MNTGDCKNLVNTWLKTNRKAVTDRKDFGIVFFGAWKGEVVLLLGVTGLRWDAPWP